MTPEILNDMELNEPKNALDSKEKEPSPTASTVGSTDGDMGRDGDLSHQADQPSQKELKDDRDQIRGLLNEARNTKMVLVDFDNAIKSGTFRGQDMMAIAKGLSFVGAIISQNKAHIDNLQMRLEKSK